MKLGFITKKRRVAAIVFLAILTIPVIILLNDNLCGTQPANTAFRITAAILFFSSILGTYLLGLPKGVVTIDENGIAIEIKKKDIFIEWKEIKYIVISKQFNGKYIGIFGENFKEKFLLNVDYTENWRLVPIAEFCDDFFYFEYQKEGLEEIKKYWDKSITNEYKVTKKKN